MTRLEVALHGAVQALAAACATYTIDAMCDARATWCAEDLTVVARSGDPHAERYVVKVTVEIEKDGERR